MTKLSPQAVYQYLIQAGATPVVAAAFTSIAGRESGFDPSAHNGDASTGDDSVGLFQINLLNGGWTSFLQQHGMQNPRAALATPQGAAQAALWIYQSSGMNPWGGYKGMPWSYNTDLNVGVAASGGKVSLGDLQAFHGGGAGGTVSPQASFSGTDATSSATGVGATPAAAKFNLPAGGRLYAVDGTFVVVYKVGADNVYYDFSEPGIGSRVNTTGTPSGAAVTHDQFYGLPNLVHAGVVSELSGKDIQGAHSYQDWLNNQLQVLTGGNKEMMNDPGVVSLLIQGAAHNWSSDEINAKLKQTTYFKTHDDAQRNWQTLSPAERQSRTNDQASQLQQAYFNETGQQIAPNDKNLQAWAAKVAGGGATITEATWQWIRPVAAKDAQSPWSRQLEQEKEAQLQQGVDVSNMGATVQQTFHDYGIKPSDQTVAQWSKDIVTKKKSQEDLTKLATNQASILYPWAKDDLQTGMTVKDIAQPWTDTYNRVMEQNTDLFNPAVQKALVQGQPVYDFEKNLKLSDDWLNTGNARQTLSQAGAEIGKAMGFA